MLYTLTSSSALDNHSKRSICVETGRGLWTEGMQGALVKSVRCMTSIQSAAQQMGSNWQEEAQTQLAWSLPLQPPSWTVLCMEKWVGNQKPLLELLTSKKPKAAMGRPAEPLEAGEDGAQRGGGGEHCSWVAEELSSMAIPKQSLVVTQGSNRRMLDPLKPSATRIQKTHLSLVIKNR